MDYVTRQHSRPNLSACLTFRPSPGNFRSSTPVDDDDDDSDDDPANWFEDDQDDGRKGQNIVEPDYEDYSDIIRIDESRIPRNNFFDHDGD